MVRNTQSATLTDAQKKWVDDSTINFSKFVRNAVDNAMKEEKERDKP